MPFPQPGIFALGTRSHYYLELDLRPDAEPEALLEVVANLREPKMTTGGANLVIAFRASAWEAAGGAVPSGLSDLVPLEAADGYHMPAAQHDVWVWASGSGYDIVFDSARAVSTAFQPIATVAVDQAGFTYRDSRDLSGFIDGTENPPLDEAPLVATVPMGQPGAGGSVVLTQRWVHDLGAFHGLEPAEQEAVIGRTKADSVELDEGIQPADSHVSRVVIEDADGDELEIFRRSTSFGSMAELGLNFVAFSADQARLDLMLQRMLGLDGSGRDRLTRFSRAVTGGYYFAPCIEDLPKSADD